ncbi:hypothetical protein [Paenisporosarcina sp. OV554]|uniref:hypothetical protein n=1 Tax=Paenisporosarcina sp. OV554 TaxID=2135694 RepID=UPI000D36B085|nr:hypothetical protein [Paenisporosarcina sp. OV554]PUB09700.1 hypothetical protein C8K15_12648 [Paenisporosarcina sp. OV554]
MSNNKWSEQKIDQLLSQVPKLQDTRSKDEVLKRLQQDQRLSEGSKVKQKRWIPAAVAIAALITLTFLGATLINKPNNFMQSAFDSNSESAKSTDMDAVTNDENKTSMEEEATIFDSASEKATPESEMSVAKAPAESNLTTVNSSDVENHTAFQIGLVSQDALVIPVTFLIPNDQIQQDFGGQSPNTLQLYEQYADDIDEEELGFIDYHPFKGTFEIDQDQLNHQLPKEHDYDLSSTALEVYDEALQYTFEGYTQVNHQNEDGSQAEFNQVGEKIPTVLSNGLYKTAVYPYTDPTGQVYLVPSLNESYDDVSEAMDALNTPPNDFFAKAIPRSVTYTVEEIKGIVHIRFTKPLELNSFSQEQSSQMIESFVLTGATFDVQVQFDNVLEEQWNDINLTQPIEQPIGLNKFSWQ